jgi:hypothetical protein
MSRTKRAVPHSFLRHPKTAQEKRSVAASVEEGVHVRFARRGRYLPTERSDKPVAALREVRRQAIHAVRVVLA